MRIGIGFDIHRLVEGRPCLVGGVQIPSDKGPEGHSDGDALCHAIADALLGACALGDIGQWFPPDDERYRGADSIKLLKIVVQELKKNGYAVVNVDSVVICEKPKISPHYEAIRQRLAEALDIPFDSLSVKSKTHEKLGPIGAGQAIAAKAVALVTKSSQ